MFFCCCSCRGGGGSGGGNGSASSVPEPTFTFEAVAPGESSSYQILHALGAAKFATQRFICSGISFDATRSLCYSSCCLAEAATCLCHPESNHEDYVLERCLQAPVRSVRGGGAGMAAGEGHLRALVVPGRRGGWGSGADSRRQGVHSQDEPHVRVSWHARVCRDRHSVHTDMVTRTRTRKMCCLDAVLQIEYFAANVHAHVSHHILRHNAYNSACRDAHPMCLGAPAPVHVDV